MMDLGNRRTDEINEVSGTGAFGFFKTEFGKVMLHKADIADKEPPVVGARYSYQLGESKDGKLKAYNATLAPSSGEKHVSNVIAPIANHDVENQLGSRRAGKVKTVNVQGGFAILEEDLGTVMLHRNDVDNNEIPVLHKTYAYTLSQRDDGQLKALDASLVHPSDTLTNANDDADEDGENSVEPIHDLYKWAYIWLGSYNKASPAITQLKELALNEDWGYREQSDPTVDEFGVLRSYLRFTFTRLSHEGKIVDDGQNAAFNTGLVDILYRPIYAFFEKNDQPNQPWKWKEFCVAGEGANGKLLPRKFTALPSPAKFFNNIDDIYFDADASFDADIKHIVLDGIKRDRYPHKFLNEYAGGFSQPEYDRSQKIDIGGHSLKVYLVELAERLEKDAGSFRKLYNRLNDAIKLAREKARWNYREVVPQYYPRHNKMSFLLPLALVDLRDEIVDTALVVQAERVEGELKYQAYTIFPLPYAYRNARLVAKPISDWLNSKNVLGRDLSNHP